VLVASLAVREAERGKNLADAAVRDALFARARAAHAEVQSGGSGVDVAASVYGGVLRYSVRGHARVALPPGTQLTVFACATSARTSDLRREVERLSAASATIYRARMDELARIAEDAADAVARADHARFVDAVARTARGLERLGDAASTAIVPAGFSELSDLAEAERAAFCVSGAGGGDVAVFVGSAPPSAAFVERAHALGLFPIDLDIDEQGVRLAPQPTASAPAELGAS
jgi:phosphomevalonate kinase